MGSARRGTRSRAKARETLWKLVKAVNRTALSLDQDSPGLRYRFSLPGVGRDHVLLTTARAFAQDAAPLAAEFIAYEMPKDFVAELETAIGNFDQAIREQYRAKLSHV